MYLSASTLKHFQRLFLTAFLLSFKLKNLYFVLWVDIIVEGRTVLVHRRNFGPLDPPPLNLIFPRDIFQI